MNMRGLLKCYYGYRNWGDELLFMGVVPYLFEYYPDLIHLDVEVGNVSWMTQRCNLNSDWWEAYQDKISFVASRTFSMWIADYDIIFAGGGEVLAAQTRNWWHGGVNYLALFWPWVWTKRVVRLGGLETPHARWSKLLYRMILPFAHQIVCREQGSYELVRRYTDKVVLYHDWAIDVLKQAESGKLKAETGGNSGTWSEGVNMEGNYVMINFIPKHTTPEIFVQFHEWITQYPDHQIINFPAEERDVLPEEIANRYSDRIITYRRWEHDVTYTLSLFRLAAAGFGLRLHFIIAFVYYSLDCYRLAYSEKVNKILQYFTK